MSLISSLPSVSAQSVRPAADLVADRPALAPSALSAPPTGSFGTVLDNLVTGVEQSQAQAADVTRSVLLGDNQNLHQSVIAMQEASLSFNLMVQVRNKVVESYQELMRLPV